MIKLKEPTLHGSFVHILENDPALDTKAEGFKDAYATFLERGTLPPIIEGLEPTIFHLEIPTDVELLGSIEDKLSGLGRRYGTELAAYSLMRVENLLVGGEQLKVEHNVVSGGFKKVTKEHRDLFGDAIFKELGIVCHNRKSPS